MQYKSHTIGDTQGNDNIFTILHEIIGEKKKTRSFPSNPTKRMQQNIQTKHPKNTTVGAPHQSVYGKEIFALAKAIKGNIFTPARTMKMR